MFSREEAIKFENPYRVVNFKRENEKRINAVSLQELMSIAQLLFHIPVHHRITIVLEQDGTEIDDEEYFATLDKKLPLMILDQNEKWTAVKLKTLTPHLMFFDDTDHCSQTSVSKINKKCNDCRMPIEILVSSLHHEPSQLSVPGNTDLEMLSDMDPNSLADIISDSFR
ncbi:uncharacterized protein LOC106641666 isoform X2 [Copidosoma floridanum]|uniref:uncharacterized protein LOC106641666 isoform X2 n=2 Tax=Copidosoma floridanum TaxID=29053 RepID=UPI000C6F53D8|nr:uncharacterized protein LOC106641666 isoform X2 [Copidosoma floridanum]